MIEIDCRKCENISKDGCILYGDDANNAVKRCAAEGFKNYSNTKTREILFKGKDIETGE